MKRPDMTQILRSLRSAVDRHGPEILTGIGIAGMITTTVLAVRATPKALRLLEAREKEKTEGPLTAAEKVKTVWTCYIPAGLTGVLSTVCLIGSCSVQGRRNAALATACSLSETALREYKGKVAETIGPKKEQSVRDEIAKDRMRENPVSGSEVVLTGKGESLCYDLLSGRYFKSDIEKLRKAQNELNRRMIGETYISLNDYYGEIGLPEIPPGEILGWNANRALMEMQFSSQLAEDGTPCLVVGFATAPVYEYNL